MPKDFLANHKQLERFDNHIVIMKEDNECNTMIIDAFSLKLWSWEYSITGDLLIIIHQTKKIRLSFGIYNYIIYINEEI